MKTRKLSMLFATLSIASSNIEATERPMSRNSYSFVEVANNTIYHHTNNIYSEQIQVQFIQKYLDELKLNPNTYMKIVSHTDNTGDWEENLNISKKRALDIADYFSGFGVPQDRIILDWLGEDAPLFFDAKDKHKNARTNIRIIKKVKKSIIKPSIVSHSNTSKLSPNQFTEQTSSTIATVSKPNVKVKKAAATNSSPETRKIVVKAKSDVKEAAKWRTVVKEKRTVESDRKVVVKDKAKVKVIRKNEDLVEKRAATLVRKSVLFINEISNAPVQVEVDLITNSGKVSASTSYKGELKMDMENLKEYNIDVYAYGYFFKSVKIEPGNNQQTIKLQPTDTGKKIELKNLQFVPGKSLLLKESNAELNRLYLSVMMNPKRKVEIGGHINVPNKTVDELTAAQMKLSVARAKSVYDYLVAKGIPKKRLTYKGYGNSEMIFKNPKNDVEKSKNRRVEVKIIE